MPAAMASAGRWPERARPRNTIRPASGGIMPKSTFISVLFPEPFSPRRPRISPSPTSRSMPSLAVTAPKRRTIPRISRSAIIAGLPQSFTGAGARCAGAPGHKQAARARPSTAGARVVLGRRDLQGAALELRRQIADLLRHGRGNDGVEFLARLVFQRRPCDGRGVVSVLHEGAEQLALLDLLGGAAEHRRPVLDDVGEHEFGRDLGLVDSASRDPDVLLLGRLDKSGFRGVE